MQFTDGGYSRNQYDYNLLRARANELAEAIPRLMRETNADAIAVTGKSGQALAFATSMLIGFPLIVVRKPNDGSHSWERVEGTEGVEVKRYLVLDDFVSSGTTIRNIVGAIDNRAHKLMVGKVTCVGVICYMKKHSSIHDERCRIYEQGEVETADERYVPMFGTKDEDDDS